MKSTKAIVWTAAGVIMFAIGLYLIKTSVPPTGAWKSLPYVAIGLGSGLFGQGSGELIHRRVLRKHPKEAKNLEIQRKDERNVMLANSAKAKGFDAMTYIFAALLLAFAWTGVSVEVILPFVAAYLSVQFYAAYCRFKQEKQF